MATFETGTDNGKTVLFIRDQKAIDLAEAIVLSQARIIKLLKQLKSKRG